MYFDKNFIERVKNSTSLSSVVSDFVSLKSKGKGQFLGLCPFHGEKTPSFTVNESKGFYHCFGCAAHGDHISFLMEMRGYSYPEAIKILADKAGIALPKEDFSSQEKQKFQKMRNGYEIMEIAANFFQNNLSDNSQEAFAAREYLRRRGLSNETIRFFRIGYAYDNWSSLQDYMNKNDIKDDALIANGLLASNDTGKQYDKFRGRIIFPICDAKGRVIAFGGRIINKASEESGKAPKYMNSPETELFSKSYVLYNYHNARDEGFKAKQIISCEGYMDVISLYQAGIKNVVAPLGTALTKYHLQHLWKICQEPIFAMDNDNAGKNAMRKIAQEYISMLKPGYSMKFLFLDDSKDPDEFISKHGKRAFEKAIDNSTPLSKALFDLTINDYKLDTPEKIAELSTELLNICNKIEDNEVKKAYIDDFKNKIYLLKRDIYSHTQAKNKKIDFNGNYNLANSNLYTKEITKLSHSIISQTEALIEKMIVLSCYNPRLLLDHAIDDFFHTIDIKDKKLEKLILSAIEFVASAEDNEHISYNSFIANLTGITQIEQSYESKNNKILAKRESDFITNPHDTKEERQDLAVFLKTHPLKANYLFDNIDETSIETKYVTVWQYLFNEMKILGIEDDILDLQNTKHKQTDISKEKIEENLVLRLNYLVSEKKRLQTLRNEFISKIEDIVN